MTTHKLAVYGTLKRDFGNHSVLGKDSKFLGAGQTKENHAMATHGPVAYKLPAVAPIAIELYEVTEDQLKGPLDRLEGHPDFYRREITSVVLNNGEEHDAWLYFVPRADPPLVAHTKIPSKDGVLSYGGYRHNL